MVREIVLVARGECSPWLLKPTITQNIFFRKTRFIHIPDILISLCAAVDAGLIRMWQYSPATSSWDSRALDGHVRGVTSLVWSQAVGRLYSGSVDRTIKVWNPADGSCTHTILPPPDKPGPAAHAGGFMSAVAAKAAGASAAATPAGAGGGNGHNSEILGLTEMTFKDLTFLVSGALDGSIKVWQLTGSPDAPTLIDAVQVQPDKDVSEEMQCSEDGAIGLTSFSCPLCAHARGL